MNEIKVLGLSGKKQSGKNTITNYIVGCWLKTLEIIVGDFKITPKGELWIPDMFGDTSQAGIFDPISAETEQFRKEHLDEFVKVYSFAEPLKEMCINIFGLTREQCYGSDDEKNSLTHLSWSNMPGVYTNKKMYMFSIESNPELGPIEVSGRLGKYYDKAGPLIYHQDGLMTAREVMQFVGTELCRRMYNDIWVDATIRKIKKEVPLIAIITDVRFENEVDGIRNLTLPCSGKVLRLNRDVFRGQDQHESETALDKYPKDNYLAVVENDNMSIDEQNSAIHNILAEIKWLPKEMK